MPGEQIVGRGVQRTKTYRLQRVGGLGLFKWQGSLRAKRKHRKTGNYPPSQRLELLHPRTLSHTFSLEIGLKVVGAHPRSYQANKPQHLSLTEHPSHSGANTFFQSEMLR